MILIKLAKNKNKTIKEAYGKYYARPVVTETIGIDELAEHMASHNTPFSKGAIKGLLTDMVSCVKELVLQNKAVKIDNLPSSPSASSTRWEPPASRSGASPSL